MTRSNKTKKELVEELESLRARNAELEKRVHERGGRFQPLFDGMTEGFALHEILCDSDDKPFDYRFLEVNPTFERLTGLERDDVIGKTVREVLPDIEPFWIETYGTVALTGKPVRFENYSAPLERHFEVFAYRPAPRQFAVLFTDITQRKQADKSILRAKKEWETTFDSVPDLIAILDKQHGIVRTNKAMADRLGVRTDQCVGLYCYEVVHGLDHPPDFCPHVLTLKDKKEHHVEVHEPRLGGDFMVSTTPMLDERGKLIGTIHVARDITDRKRVETTLLESEEALNRAQAVAHTGSWRLDTRHNVLLWSDENHRIFGIPKGTPMTYETFLTTVHPEDRGYVDEKWTAALRGEPYDIEHRIIVDGNIKWVRERAELDFDEDGVLIGGFGTTQDITERKKAEETLKESEALLRLAQVSAGAGIWDWDMSSGKLQWSQELFRLFGLDPSENEASFDSWKSIIYSDDRQRADEYIKRAIDNRTPLSNEYRIVLPSGQIRWIHALGNTIYDSDGRPQRMSGICLDVTQRKEFEETLRKAKNEAENATKRLQAIMQALPVGVALLDAQGGNKRSNDVFEAIWNGALPPAHNAKEYASRKAWWAYTGKPVQSEEWASAQAALKGETVIGQLLDIQRFDGTRGFIINSAAPVRDSANNIVGAAVAIQDITELKRAEQELRESLHRFEILAGAGEELLRSTEPQKLVEGLCRKVMEHLDCHTFFNFLVDDKVGRLHLNAYAGISPEEAENIEWLDYGSAVCGCVARDATRIVAEHILTTPDERTEFVKSYGIKAYACHPLMRPAGKVIGTLSFGTKSRETFNDDDLSLMKAVADMVATAMIRIQSEQALRESEGRYRHLSENLQETVKQKTAALLHAERLAALGQMVSTVAHEVRNPIQTIQMGVDALRKVLHDEKDKEEILEEIEYGARMLAGTISDLLNYSRPVELELSPTPVQKVVEAALKLLADRLKKIHTSIELERGGEKIHVDTVKFTEVLVNIMSNAAEAMPDGGSLRVCSRFSEGNGARLLAMSITDTGHGIDEKHMEEIYKPFFTTKTRGTGLGIPLCKKILDAHNGTMTIKSIIGKGTTVELTIPVDSG